MRLIDADALMEELEREVELADDWKTAHEIANCVKYAPTVSGWISVKNRLPPIYQMVLITGKNSAGGSFGVIKGSYDGHNYNWYRDDIGQYVNHRGETVTHWMPLPEPPKEVSEDD